MVKILMLGDIVGRPGRNAVVSHLPSLKDRLGADIVIANGENASGGMGLKKDAINALKNSGVDVITSGNHIWRYKEILPQIERGDVLRPHNYSGDTPGSGIALITEKRSGLTVGVLNLQGRIFMEPIDNPLHVATAAIDEIKSQGADIIVVDFHAEATAEKEATGWFLNGKVSLVVGTHTHVQTADEKILPKGLGYITDLGRCGAFYSVLGFRPQESINGLLTGRKYSYKVSSDTVHIEGVIAEIDNETGHCLTIERVRISYE